MNRFADKNVLITGAASGIGRATALRLAAEGASVWCADIAEEGAEETAALAREQGAPGAAAMRLDVADEDSVAACFSACLARFGALDALCHVAGILHYRDFIDLSLAEWRRVLSVNLDGAFLCNRAALPHLLERKGNIVNISSNSALRGFAYGAAYSASKGGLLSLTQSLAVEFAARGVRVNNVCPGTIKTQMTQGVNKDLQNNVKAVDMDLLMRLNTLTEAGGPEKVASVVAMLASDDGSHITGASIVVDGGSLA